MIAEAWWFIGMIATLATGLALLKNDDGLATLTGVLGFVGWGVWTYGAFSLEIARNATIYSFSEPAVALVGVALALIPGWIALTGPMEILGRYRDIGQENL
jgi:hypothetical protein